MNPFFKDMTLYFEFLRVVNKALEHGADIGECIHTAQQIKEGSVLETCASWQAEWEKLAQRIHRIADECLAKGHRVSARDAYLRAAEYYRAAEFFLHSPEHADDPGMLELSGTWHACFNKARVLFDPPFESVAIPYEGNTLPAYFIRGNPKGRRAPTLILNTGFDGTAEEQVLEFGFDAARRGYNCLCFEGPGQGQVVRRQKLYFRPDWEKVVTPLVDYLLTRKEVDAKRIVLYGISMGGYLAPRAAAYEHRLAACIANGGILDFFDVNTAGFNISREERIKLIRTQPAELDKLVRQVMLQSLQVHWAMNHGPWVFGVKTAGAYFEKLLAYTLADCAGQIACPTLVIDAEKEHFMAGQARQLYDVLKCPKAMIVFKTDEGADLHCQIGAHLLSNQRIYDWLDETLAKI